jgi:hypothetical protein
MNKPEGLKDAWKHTWNAYFLVHENSGLSKSVCDVFNKRQILPEPANKSTKFLWLKELLIMAQLTCI